MSSYKFFAATALLAALPSALAGNAIINNNCNFPVYVTPSESGTDAAQKEYGPGQSFNEPIKGEAVCLKVMTEKGFCMTDNCIQLEYTSDKNTLWYDLSNINAGALGKLMNYGMTVNVSDPDAQQIDCPAGDGFHGCKNTYYQWFENENSLSAKPDSTLTMNLCSGSGSSLASASHAGSSAVSQASSVAASVMAPASSAMSSVAAQASQAAPSVATHAPIVPQVEHSQEGSHGPEVIVTVTQTMMAREEETAAPEKRHIHAHAHHHRH